MSHDEAHDSAIAIAYVMAEATSYIFADCYLDWEGFACAEAGTRIAETAHAVAVAYADIWAKAVSCKTCKVSVDSWVLAVSEILAKAASKAHGEVCTSASLSTFSPTVFLQHSGSVSYSRFPDICYCLWSLN